MGYIGSISHGTAEEKAVYARALGQVLVLGALIRDVRPMNERTMMDRALRWVGWA